MRFAGLSLLLCLNLVPVLSHAQVNPFQSSRIGSGLNDADRREMSSAARRLYEQEAPANGASDTWSNPKTGNSGTVTVLESFTHQQMQCRKVKYDIRLRKRTAPRSYTVNWCKTPAGAWKVLS